MENIYADRSDVSYKQSFVYTSICIELDIIEQYHYEKNQNDHSSSNTWNEGYDDFDQQL